MSKMNEIFIRMDPIFEECIEKCMKNELDANKQIVCLGLLLKNLHEFKNLGCPQNVLMKHIKSYIKQVYEGK